MIALKELEEQIPAVTKRDASGKEKVVKPTGYDYTQFNGKLRDLWTTAGKQMRKPQSFELANALAKSDQSILNADLMNKKHSGCGPIASLCRAVLDFYGDNFEANFAVKKAYVRLKSNSDALALILKPKNQTV